MPASNFASGAIWASDNLPVMRGMNSDCVDLLLRGTPKPLSWAYAMLTPCLPPAGLL